MSRTIGHNGTTGWVVSRRLDERGAKRTTRREALRVAWDEVAEAEAAEAAEIARIAAEIEAAWEARQEAETEAFFAAWV